MSDLKEYVKNLKMLSELASSDPGNDPRSYNVKAGKIRRAKEDMKELFIKYKQELKRRTVFILPHGADHEVFSSIASKELGCFLSKSDDLFNTITENVNPSLYMGKTFSPSMLTTVSSIFENIANEMDILAYNQLLFKNEYAVSIANDEDFTSLIRKIITETVGSEIVGYYAIHKTAQEAWKEEFGGKVVPIIIDNSDGNLFSKLQNDLERITLKVFPVEVSGEVTLESVTKELTKIKKKF